MGAHPLGPDYGMFEFGDLFSETLLGRPYRELASDECAALVPRFEHKVSDHDARAGPAHGGEAVCRLLGFRFLFRLLGLVHGPAAPVRPAVSRRVFHAVRSRRTIYTQ